MVDGPSLGGFVCPATVPLADRWKIGQLKPGDKIRFTKVTLADVRCSIVIMVATVLLSEITHRAVISIFV